MSLFGAPGGFLDGAILARCGDGVAAEGTRSAGRWRWRWVLFWVGVGGAAWLTEGDVVHTAVVVSGGLVALFVLWLARLWWRLGAGGRRRRRLLAYTAEDLDALTGLEFEAWLVEVLHAGGLATQDTAKTGDFGVDVIASYRNRRIGIQAKKRRGRNIGNKAVQEANAGADYYSCEIAAVVTQSGFTKAAKAQADGLARPCLLLGRDELPQLADHLKQAVTAFVSE